MRTFWSYFQVLVNPKKHTPYSLFKEYFFLFSKPILTTKTVQEGEEFVKTFKT